MSRREVIGVAALAVLAAVIHGPRLQHPFVTDDAIYIVENPAVTTGAPLAAYFLDRTTVASNPDFQWQSYRPLRTLAFRAVARVAGVRPLPFGLVNLTLFLTSALLLLGLGRRLGTGSGWWGAALWVAAPVHVESVLYASALGDQLSLALELGGLWLALDGLQSERWRPGRAAVAWGLVAAAMLAKEMAVTAPVLLALLAWGTGDWRARPRRARLTIAAHGAAALLFLAARTLVLKAVGHGATTVDGALSQLAMVPWRLGAYLVIALEPLGHSAAYVLPPPGASWLVMSWMALAVGGWWALRTSALVRVGLGWFGIALLPVLGLVPIFADLADRFALLPTVGLAWLVPLAVSALARRWAPLGVLAPTSLLLIYSAGSVVEGAAWSDELVLWRKAAALEPRSAQAQRNLGLILLQRGQPAEALVHLDEARSLGEAAGELDRRRAMALEALGRLVEAEAAAAEAVRRDPGLGSAHALRGGLLLRLRGVESAEEALTLARRADPDGVSTLLLEAQVAAARGDARRELAAVGRLVQRFPREPRFRYQLGEAQLRAGDPRAAIASAEVCLAALGAQRECLCLRGRGALATGGTPSPSEQAACAPTR